MEKLFIVLKEVGRQIVVILAKLIYFMVMGIIAICKYISNKYKNHKRAESRPVYTVIENAVPKKPLSEEKKTIPEPKQETITSTPKPESTIEVEPVVVSTEPAASLEQQSKPTVIIDFTDKPVEEETKPAIKMVFSEDTTPAEIVKPVDIEVKPEVIEKKPEPKSEPEPQIVKETPKVKKTKPKPKPSTDPRDNYTEGSLF